MLLRRNLLKFGLGATVAAVAAPIIATVPRTIIKPDATLWPGWSASGPLLKPDSVGLNYRDPPFIGHNQIVTKTIEGYFDPPWMYALDTSVTIDIEGYSPEAVPMWPGDIVPMFDSSGNRSEAYVDSWSTTSYDATGSKVRMRLVPIGRQDVGAPVEVAGIKPHSMTIDRHYDRGHRWWVQPMPTMEVLREVYDPA